MLREALKRPWLVTRQDFEVFLTKNKINWFKIDELHRSGDWRVFVYNRVLDEMEITQNFNALRPGIIIRIPAFRYIFRRRKVLKKMKQLAPAALRINFKAEG